jgi:hypothetical protein
MGRFSVTIGQLLSPPSSGLAWSPPLKLSTSKCSAHASPQSRPCKNKPRAIPRTGRSAFLVDGFPFCSASTVLLVCWKTNSSTRPTSACWGKTGSRDISAQLLFPNPSLTHSRTSPMTAKRKHQEIATTWKPNGSEEEPSDAPSLPRPSVKDYPRKRVAIAVGITFDIT